MSSSTRRALLFTPHRPYIASEALRPQVSSTPNASLKPTHNVPSPTLVPPAPRRIQNSVLAVASYNNAHPSPRLRPVRAMCRAASSASAASRCLTPPRRCVCSMAQACTTTPSTRGCERGASCTQRQAGSARSLGCRIRAVIHLTNFGPEEKFPSASCPPHPSSDGYRVTVGTWPSCVRCRHLAYAPACRHLITGEAGIGELARIR